MRTVAAVPTIYWAVYKSMPLNLGRLSMKQQLTSTQKYVAGQNWTNRIRSGSLVRNLTPKQTPALGLSSLHGGWSWRTTSWVQMLFSIERFNAHTCTRSSSTRMHKRLWWIYIGHMQSHAACNMLGQWMVSHCNSFIVNYMGPVRM